MTEGEKKQLFVVDFLRMRSSVGRLVKAQRETRQKVKDLTRGPGTDNSILGISDLKQEQVTNKASEYQI
jgi:hypothetical protein